MDIQSLRGMPDLFPEDLKKWHILESTLATLFNSLGIKEIRTPLLESTELFNRSVGNSSDIVNKELYSFLDRNDKSISLRPEGSASVIRAIIQKKQEHEKHKLWYQGPMFRYERPQKGRFRQFHQVGVEYLGYEEGLAEYELLSMLIQLIGQLGIKSYKIKINHLGDQDTKENFSNALKLFLEPHLDVLHEKDVARLHSNPLRILDSKEESTQALLLKAPKFQDFLSSESLTYLTQIEEHFADQCEMVIDSSLVRGLDYYTGIVFEIISDDLGAQDSFSGGGRYDGLSNELGGKKMHAIGFAIGLERIIDLMSMELVPLLQKVALIIMGEQDQQKTYKIAHVLREANPNVILDAFLSESSLKAHLKRANKHQHDFAIIVGEEEREVDSYLWKDLSPEGSQELLQFEALLKKYKNL
ncbi:histidine--tRNA ligase [Gammaproteobacteria bacterium]|nr:histidine--tRNA ligase [Gammaproteobacteria bacterium]MDC1525384.1 histidine--tRNA ligase [Gammaproteobacteria bacterium]